MLSIYFFSLYCAVYKPAAYIEALKEAEYLSAAELNGRIQSAELAITKLHTKSKQLSSEKNSILTTSLNTRRCYLAAYQKVRRQKKR